MPTIELEPFHRELDENQELSDHQRNFLYLPLSIFRDFTNIRSIIIKHDRRKDGKPLKEIEIKHKIKQRHNQMINLEKWNDLHLDELNFMPSNPERV